MHDSASSSSSHSSVPIDSSDDGGGVLVAGESRAARIWRHYDLGNIALVAALIVLLIGIEQFSPRHRYIPSETDPSISYPLVKQQVPIWLLIVLVEALPVAAFLAIYLAQRSKAHAKRELYRVLWGFVFSMVLTLVLTEFTKRVVGRPRPNFIALSGLKSGVFSAAERKVNNAFMSFPSGHTSTAFSGLGFLSLYLFRLLFPHRRPMRDLVQGSYQTNQGWKTLLCLLPLVLAAWIGMSRLVDYYHNYDDVGVGAVLGFGVCALTFHLHVNWAAPELPSAGGGRRNSGPSVAPLHFTAPASMSSPGRKQANLGGDDAPDSNHDAPLLVSQV